MSGDPPRLEATRYADGTLSSPGHPFGVTGATPVETIDLTTMQGRIVTWTSSTATPPGVRSPNHLGIVEFSINETETVRVIGQLTTDSVEIGDLVEPVYTEELRNPAEGIRKRESQRWDGYRFRPIAKND